MTQNASVACLRTRGTWVYREPERERERESFIMRPSSLGGGRILRRTLVCLSVRPVIVAIGNVFSSTASVTDVLFGTH